MATMSISHGSKRTVMRGESFNKSIHAVVRENEVKLAKQAEIYLNHQAMKTQDKQMDRVYLNTSKLF